MTTLLDIPIELINYISEQAGAYGIFLRMTCKFFATNMRVRKVNIHELLESILMFEWICNHCKSTNLDAILSGYVNSHIDVLSGDTLMALIHREYGIANGHMLFVEAAKRGDLELLRDLYVSRPFKSGECPDSKSDDHCDCLTHIHRVDKCTWKCAWMDKKGRYECRQIIKPTCNWNKAIVREAKKHGHDNILNYMCGADPGLIKYVEKPKKIKLKCVLDHYPSINRNMDSIEEE